MTTRKTNPVGASNIHPATSGTPTPGTEVTTPGSTTPVTTTGAPMILLPGSPVLVVMTAGLKTFKEGLQALLAAFTTHLLVIAAADRTRRGKVSRKQQDAMALITNLLRLHTDMVVGATPDQIDAEAALGTAMRTVAANLTALAQKVDDTGRTLLEGAWMEASAAYSHATVRVRQDPNLAVDLAPIQTALRTGTRVAATTRNVHVQQVKATAAQTRALKAAQRAVLAGHSLTRAQQAALDRQQVRAGLNPQGPSATVDVNPQGPAPTAGPGTPQGGTPGR